MRGINIKYQWPESILRFAFARFSDDEINSIMSSKKKLATINYVVDTEFTERQKEICFMYFKEKMTYQTIADILGFRSNEYVRQVLIICTRKIIKNKNIILMGVKEYYETMAKVSVAAQRIMTGNAEQIDLDIGINFLRMDISEIGLSPRSATYLKKGGINKVWTLYLTPYERLMNLSNIGEKSFSEIVNKMLSYGLTFFKESDEDELDRRMTMVEKELKIDLYSWYKSNPWYLSITYNPFKTPD